MVEREHNRKESHTHVSTLEPSRDDVGARAITHAEGGAQAATVASADALADMKKKGITPREHYYRTAERQQTGEIQETFLINERLGEKPEDVTEQDA